MVLWVAEASAAAVGRQNVIVATEDPRIQSVAEAAGFRAEMTSKHALTGTDRVAEVALRNGGVTVINVQGDEPMVDPHDILAIASAHQKNPSVIVNGKTRLLPSENPLRTTIPKVVTDLNDRLLYISRKDIPGTKNADSPLEYSTFMKQVCIYAFSPDQLRQFSARTTKTPLEDTEDIEILRFLELGFSVQMVETRFGSLAVDTPEDVATVEAAMREKGFGT